MIKELTEKNLKQLVKQATEILQDGGAVIFPTDTLYGLGVDALNSEAIEYFFTLKKRPTDKPIPVFVSGIEEARQAAFIDERQENIIKKLWPGPFTVVLNKKEIFSERLSAGTDTIGLRSPDSKFCRRLLGEFGGPITASSANISGMEPSLDINKIIEQFEEHSDIPELVIDAGILEPSEPSTVIDIREEKPKILRLNNSTKEKLKEVFGDKISW